MNVCVRDFMDDMRNMFSNFTKEQDKRYFTGSYKRNKKPKF